MRIGDKNWKQTMKKFILFIALSLLAGTTIGYAQSAKDLIKERKALAKQSKAELNEKASKAARKEAKKLKKEGWQTTPGALPLDKQLDRSFLMQYEFDAEGYPKYFYGEAMSIGQNYDGAKMQALELAKLNLAGSIQQEVTALIENSVANEQLAPEEANTVTKSVEAAKGLISQKIGRTVTVVEAYRTLSNKNKEVMVRIAYNSAMAKAAAKAAMRESLEKESKDLHKKLDDILGW